LHRRSFTPVLSLLGSLADSAEWDPDLSWVPDVDEDPELAAILPR
jgi:hypothetical protein